MLRNRVCSITTCLSHSEQNRIDSITGFTYGIHTLVLFLLHVLHKNENINNAGYRVLSEYPKINSQRAKTTVLIAKISSRKTQKIANPLK